MPPNRFTKSHQISERVFQGIVFDYVLEVSPQVTADRVGVSAKTVHRYVRLLRKRLFDLNSGKLPAAEDTVWDDVHFCLYECPNLIHEKFELKQVYHYAFLLPSSRRGKNLEIPRRRNLGKCSNCKLTSPFELPELVQFRLSLMQSNARRYDRKDFPYFLIETCTFQHYRKVRVHPKQSTLDLALFLLRSCWENPL